MTANRITHERLMARHARSFAPATRLLARDDRSRVARLYALCRTIDDLADEHGEEGGKERLECLLAALYRADRSDPIAAEARDLFSGRSAGLSALALLVEAAAADTADSCLEDDAELDRYCMGVAGSVGLMMCALFAVPRRWHAAAIDLGKAMQLTNICRDVAADARAGRRYLPKTLCPHLPMAIAAATPAAIADARVAIAVLLGRADGLYRSGRAGLDALPPRLRLAVAAAAAMYAGIGTELRQRGCDPTLGRAVVPLHRKATLATAAVLDQIRRPSRQTVEEQHALT